MILNTLISVMDVIHQAKSQVLFVILSILTIINLMLELQVQADELTRGDSVITRQHPELDPLGIRIGGLFLLPRLLIGVEHNDNIFAVNSGKRSDTITLIEPIIELVSNWNIHSLGLKLDYVAARYADSGDENYDDYSVELQGRVDISTNNYFNGTTKYEQLHEARTSPDDINGIRPTKYTETNILASFTHKSERKLFLVDGTITALDYDKTQTTTDVINNDDRDRVKSVVNIQLGYFANSRSQIFIRTGVNAIKYDQEIDNEGFNKKSHGYDLVIGTVLLSGVIDTNFYIGYLTQFYKDGRYDDIGENTFGGELAWNPSGLTTITGRINRQIDETTFEYSSSSLVTDYELAIDHELRRYLILHGAILQQQLDYKGIIREDDVFNANVSVIYKLNRKINIGFDYNYQDRKSEPYLDGSNNYKNNIFTISVKGQI
ncbi:MAG: outer membrane beta-barrel protein [Thiohalomonadales bacterium]